MMISFLSNDLDRERWVRAKIRSIDNNESIIDVGAGEGRFKKYCEHLKYTSQDFGEYKGTGDGVGLQTGEWNTGEVDILSDITKIPAKNGSFDNVLCTEVLEHVPHPEAAINEMARILKRNGRLIITAPFISHTHFSPYYFCTGFSRYWYQEVLGGYGFEINEIEPRGNYFDFVCQELVRVPLVLKRYCSLGVLSYLLYLFLVPVTILVYLISKITRGSSEQACFGWHVEARKVK